MVVSQGLFVETPLSKFECVLLHNVSGCSCMRDQGRSQRSIMTQVCAEPSDVDDCFTSRRGGFVLIARLQLQIHVSIEVSAYPVSHKEPL